MTERIGALTQVGVELFLGLALRLEESLEQVLVVVHRVDDVVLAIAGLGRDRRLGRVELDVVDQVLEHLVARLRSLAQCLDPSEPGAQVGAQLVDGVELARQLGEVVVGRRQLLHLDRR